MGLKFVDKTMLYGRARRVKLVKQVSLIVIVVLLLVLAISFLFKENKYVDRNVNYAMLKSYFNGKGYSCVQLERDGGRCVNDQESYYYSFTRYADGFIFLKKTSTYTIQIRHVKSTNNNDISISTNSNSLAGTRDKTYYCITDDGLVGTLKSCVTDSGDELTTQSYLGEVEDVISDLNQIINASGYNKDSLLDDYEWVRSI